MQDTGRDQATEPLLASTTAMIQVAADDRGTRLCCLGVMVLVSISYQFSDAPILQLYGDFICGGTPRSLSHPNMGADERQCRFDPNQIEKKVASIMSKQVILDTALGNLPRPPTQIRCAYGIALIASVYMPSLLRKRGLRRMLQLNLSFHIVGKLWIYFIRKQIPSVSLVPLK